VKANIAIYDKIRSQALDKIKSFLVADRKPRIAIYDACSHTKETRKWLIEKIGPKIKIIFIECIVNDPMILKNYLGELRNSMPDYEGMDFNEALEDYQKRIQHFRRLYEPMHNSALR